MRRAGRWTAVVMLAGLGALPGCRTESSKSADGERVKVTSPFGGLQVKVRTDDQAAEVGTGLPVYPGATLVKKDDGKQEEHGTADINLSLGAMHLRIEVLSYRTDDSPEKVQSFYAKELGRFGAVITCENERAVGSPTRTPEGLSCEKDSRSSVNVASDDGESGSAVQLKAGSHQHQHAVSLEKDGRGTKFALIRIDLPERFSLGDDGDKTDKRQ